MRSRILLGLSWVLSIALASNAGAAVVAHWMFDEGSGGSANSTVGGWTGTLVNFPDTSPGVGDATGTAGWISGGGLNFNSMAGQPGAARVDTNFPIFSQLSGSSFTLEYVSSHNDPAQNWSPFIGQSGGCCFFFGKTAGQESLHVNFNGLGAVTTPLIADLTDGRQHHLAAVFDDTADTITMYFDGTQVYQRPGVTGTLNDQGNLWLGSVAHQPVNEYWNGAVDQVRISNTALAPSEFLLPPASAAPQTVAEWDFSEGSGTTASSSVGGWTGTLVNFADTSAGVGDTPGSEGWTSDGRINVQGNPQNGRIETDFPLGSLSGKSFTIEYIATQDDAGANWSPLIGQSGGCCFFVGKTAGQSKLHSNLNGLVNTGTGTPDVPLADGNSHHVAVVFDDATNTYMTYFDYVPVGRNGADGVLNDQGFLWLSTVAHQPVNEQYAGVLDHVRITEGVLRANDFVGAPANLGVDLTEPGGVQAKYVVGLGRAFSDTVIPGKAPNGVIDYGLGRGNGGPWWQANDGVTDLSQNINTFAAATVGGEDFVGYLFKAPVRDISAIQWSNRAFGDGGTFDAQPRVEYLDAPLEDGGTWQTMAVTFNTPYDRSLGGNQLRSYIITPDDPNLKGVWGIRLIGPPNVDNPPGPDPDGFIAMTDLNVLGQIDLPVDFSNNLASQVNGGMAIMSHAQGGNPWAINDGDLLTREQTFGAGGAPEDFAGVMWADPQSDLTAVGITFKRFVDGGLFTPGTLRIETTSDGSTWTDVSGLETYRYDDIAPFLIDFGNPGGVSFPPEQSFLFTFSPADDVLGIRAIGQPEGSVDVNGFIGVFELEVFQTAQAQAIPEPSSIALLVFGAVGLLLAARRRKK